MAGRCRQRRRPAIALTDGPILDRTVWGEDAFVLPDDISLHDAGITAIARKGGDVVVHVECVQVPRANGTPLSPAFDDMEMATGTVTIVGVRAILLNDEPVAEFSMAGDSCDIIRFDWKARGRADVFIVWHRYGPLKAQVYNHYQIECDDLVWTQTGLMPPGS
jgi:hypothetical protein